MAILLMLLVAVDASAAPHHEDYDRAELDVQILVLYIQDTFSSLNITLAKMNDLDIRAASEKEALFRNNIEDARRTLSTIPEDVDSYDFLDLIVSGLGFMDENLTGIMNGMISVLDALENLSSYRFTLWEAASISENLSRVDRALFLFDNGIMSMENGRSGLEGAMAGMNDSSWFAEFGIGPEDLGFEGIRSSLQDMNDVLTGLSGNRTMMEDVMKDLMKTPMLHWHEALMSILMEDPVGGALDRDVDILVSSRSGLSRRMMDGTASLVNGMKVAWNASSGMSSLQQLFMANMTLLETNSSKNPFSELITFQRCEDYLEDMYEKEGELLDVLSDLSVYDNGTISSDLDDIHMMLADYKDRLDSLDIWLPELQRFADGISSLMEGSNISADADESGNLSDEEVSRIVLDSNLLQMAGNLSRKMEMLMDDLAAIPSGYFDETREAVDILDKCLFHAERFTTTHMALISTLRGLVPNGTRGGGDAENVRTGLGLAESARGDLISLHTGGDELEAWGIHLDMDWYPYLLGLLDLYRSFILSRKEVLTEPIIVLTIERTSAPYDTDVVFSVFAIDIDSQGDPYLPDGREFTFSFGGGDGVNLTMAEGSYSGIIPVTRELLPGPYHVNVSMMSENGSLINDSGVIDVRRLFTSVVLVPSRLDLLAGEEASARVVVRDELRRIVTGEVISENVSFPVPGNVSFGMPPLGKNSFQVAFPGNSYMEPSTAVLEAAVMQTPLLRLSAPLTFIGRNDTVIVRLELLRGNGTVSLFFDEIPTNETSMPEGGTSTFMLDPFILGNGTWLVKAHFRGYDGITLPGWSDPLMIRIDLSLPEAPVNEGEEEPEVNETPANGEELPTPDNGTSPWDPPGPLTREGFYWLIFAISAAAIILAVVFSIVRRRRTGVPSRGGADPFHFPRVYVRPRKVRTVKDAGSENGGIDGKASRYMESGVGASITRRDLIRYYLDLIESSPHELGLSRSMTPREVARKLMENGLDRETARAVAFDFEWSIYKLGIPEEETVRSFRSREESVKGWFRSILSRMGLEASAAPDERGGRGGRQ